MLPGPLNTISGKASTRRCAPVQSYTVLFTVVLVAVIWINRADPEVFGRFLGPVHPVVLTLLCGTSGAVCLSYLRRRFRLPVFQWPTLKSSLVPVTGAVLFGAVVIAIDLWLRLPEDLNIRFPVSVAFYPAIGFLAEVIFHVMPVSVAALFIARMRIFDHREKVLGASMFAFSFFEPLYQVSAMHHTGLYEALTLVIIGIHIWLINLFQLFIFKKSGFYHMYLFRLGYYLIWHVAWGYFRLGPV